MQMPCISPSTSSGNRRTAPFPNVKASRSAPGHKVYPYWLRNMAITKPDQISASDITYIPLQHGSLHLTAILELYSRNVLSWPLSNKLTGVSRRP